MTASLESVPLFQHFTPEMLDVLSQQMQVRAVAAGDVICREGEEGDAVYLIESGQVEIRKKNKTLTVFGPGRVFGEMALFENARRSADAVAVTDCRLHSIRNADFKALIAANLEACALFLFDSVSEISQRLRRTSEYLITMYDTGRIVGSDLGMSEMTDAILRRLVEDIDEASGGMILLWNRYTDVFEEVCGTGAPGCQREDVLSRIHENRDSDLEFEANGRHVFGVAIRTDEAQVLGYIILETAAGGTPFSVEQRIIVAAVGNQVGLGILKAYGRQEEEARQRLERQRWERQSRNA